MSMAQATPWAVQCDVAKKLEKDDYQDASLQLALCLYLGFGVKPDRERMFQYLESARVGSSLGRALHYRISSTFQKEIDTELLTDPDSKLLNCVTDDTYFLKRIWTYQRSTPKVDLSKAVQGLQLNDLPLINIVEIQNSTLLARVLREQRYSDIDISAALSAACRQGNAKSALQLISVCNDLVPDPEQPSPLHWLIMFPDSEAREMIHALVRGISSGGKGPCREFLNFVPTAGPGTVFFSEHCMELFGTPLHWAVRARKLEVVKLLVEMGSDFNARWGGPRRFNTDVSKPGRPNMSPLDVAVTFHLPEIAYYLLEIGAETSGGAFEESHSAFACVGLACVPFSRYIIHGPNYRKAAVRTIRVLVDHGLNILDTDTNGYGPLLVALRDPDCDSYIVEELLSAGAVANSVTFDDHSNAAILVTQSSALRPYSVKNLELVVHQVVDINALDSFGRNALHYAAIGGSAGMIEVLLNVNGIDVDMKDSGGLNALHFAATFGCTEALSALIAGGAKIDDLDSRGGTALTSAVQFRKTIAANLLLDAGASPFFTFESSPTVGTMLHVAAAGAGSGESILRVLLENRPELQTPSILDATNQIGWTALHKAAYFGDHDAVETLLDYGADSTLKSKSGKTALDVAVTLLKQVTERGLGMDHQRVRQKGQQAVEIFVAGLTHIKEMLQYAMDS
jgi:ankyrin repeat protein